MLHKSQTSIPTTEKKIFEKFQSQGFEVIHNVSTSILILQVIVIERAHSCHQICNILSSLP